MYLSSLVYCTENPQSHQNQTESEVKRERRRKREKELYMEEGETKGDRVRERDPM